MIRGVLFGASLFLGPKYFQQKEVTAMADLKQRKISLVRGILGHDAAPAKVVLRGMADLEKALGRRFRDLQKQRGQSAQANAELRNQLLGPQKKDAAWAASMRRRQERLKSLRPQSAAPHKVVAPKERVFLGSLGGTRIAPFDYPWTWSAKTGSPSVSTEASTSTGDISISIMTGDKAASASARAAVGIFFSSPIDCVSNFSFWSSPSLAFSWEEFCSLDSAHTDGFIGLYAASYDWAGNFTATVVDQMISLWSNNSWWDDANGGNSNRAYPLSANFQVDPDHWYVLWVWCGSDDSGDGFGTFSGSSAISDFGVRVPAISWEVG
jgi:hypothetical protein